MRTKTVLIGFLMVIAIVVVFYIKHLRSSLDDALTELATVNASNVMLKTADDVSRVITNQQLKIEQSLREKADEKAHELQRELSNSDCASVRLPTAIIDRLRE